MNKLILLTVGVLLGICLGMVSGAFAQTTPAPSEDNSSFIDAKGTAHITRIVPVPRTISPEAQRVLAKQGSDAAVSMSLEQRRSGTDTWQNGAGAASKLIYPAEVREQTVAGVPVRIIDPVGGPKLHTGSVLINLHGGGFDSDSGSLTETIPIANLTKTRVIAVLYRLAPEHPFPAAVDDVVAVYREVLKTYKPRHVAIYGTSAGAILTAQVAVRLKQLSMPLPGALGIFSGLGDFTRAGDSASLYALNGLTGHLDVPGERLLDMPYVGATSGTDPVLSPIFADLHGLPPTLFITSGRDLLLSGTTLLHRAYLRDGVDARLIVFEALPHAFWNDVSLPESREAFADMADFFSRQMNAAGP